MALDKSKVEQVIQLTPEQVEAILTEWVERNYEAKVDSVYLETGLLDDRTGLNGLTCAHVHYFNVPEVTTSLAAQIESVERQGQQR